MTNHLAFQPPGDSGTDRRMFNGFVDKAMDFSVLLNTLNFCLREAG